MSVIVRALRTVRARRALNPPPGAAYVLRYGDGWWELTGLGCFLARTADGMSVAMGAAAGTGEDELREFAEADLGRPVHLEPFGHEAGPAFWVTPDGPAFPPRRTGDDEEVPW